jgi:hypothetical protein
MDQKQLITKLDNLKIKNLDKDGNIVELIASAVLTEEKKVELVLYSIKTKEPLLKFVIDAMGCDTKLMELLTYSYKLYLEQENKNEIYKKDNKPFFQYTKEGSC